MISNTNTGSASAPGASLLSRPEQTGIANVNQTVRAVCPLPQQALALLAPLVHLESLFLFADFGGQIVDLALLSGQACLFGRDSSRDDRVVVGSGHVGHGFDRMPC